MPFFTSRASLLRSSDVLSLSQDKTNQVLENFYNYKYDEAIDILKAELQDFAETDKLPPAFQDELNIVDTQGSTSISANQDARRYFQTTLGQLHLGSFVDAPAVSAVTEHRDKMKATNGAEVERAILTWTDAEKLNKKARLGEGYYRAQSTNAPIKDRKCKLGFSSKRDLADSSKKTDVVASHQGGVLRQTSPFFPDEINYQTLVEPSSGYLYSQLPGRLVSDSRPVRHLHTDSFPAMYNVMGRLEQYVSANAKDPNLQKNVSKRSSRCARRTDITTIVRSVMFSPNRLSTKRSRAMELHPI